MAKNQVQTEAFPLAGGLDLVSPALSLKPGNLIDSQNFEPDINGGYRRMYGIESFDGRPSPSDADYWVMTVVISSTISAGDTVTGATSGATAVVLQVNGSTELIVTKLTGTFVAETLNVGGNPKATVSAVNKNNATTPLLHATYANLAADNYRADITTIPGSGVVRGVWYYNGNVYAFRDNVGASACIMYKATTSGWSAVTLFYEVQFTAGGTATPVDGETLTKGGVTATVRRVLTRTGTWGGTAAGTFVISAPAGGNFSAGAATLSGGATVTLVGIQTSIALQAGGRFEFANYNFSGTLSTYRMFFCDGVNFLHEFDGTYLVPIRTGIAGDNPKYLAPWKNMMVMAISSSVQVSGIGAPYSYTALTGAAELALGDTCTGLLPQLGDENSGALAVFTTGTTRILYGNSTADFKLVIQSPDAGNQPYCCQNIGFAYYLDTKGVVQINSTKNYGNFIMSTLSRQIQPIIDNKRGLAKASCIVRSTNQYRVFYSDGTGIIVYVQGDQLGGLMYFDYGSWLGTNRYMNTVVSFVDSSGIERILASGSDGYVYELDVGTSLDGENIQSHLFTAFNSNKSPRNRKHYRRTILQATCKGVASVSIGYELGYGDLENDSGVRSSQTLIGGGTYWDIGYWDTFNWDSPYVSEYIIDTPGDGKNIGMVIYGDSDIDLPYTIHSAITNYTVRRLER